MPRVLYSGTFSVMYPSIRLPGCWWCRRSTARLQRAGSRSVPPGQLMLEAPTDFITEGISTRSYGVAAGFLGGAASWRGAFPGAAWATGCRSPGRGPAHLCCCSTPRTDVDDGLSHAADGA